MTVTPSLRIAVVTVFAVSLLILTPYPAPAQSEPLPSDPGIIVRQSGLRAEPSEKSQTEATLALGHRVEVVGFSGRWARVRAADSGEGRIPAANVRISQSEAGGGSTMTGFLRRITGAVARKPSSSQSSAHMGIRGLEPRDVANARPDPVELGKLDAYRATRPMAERHARTAQLATRALDYAKSSRGSGGQPVSTATPSDRN